MPATKPEADSVWRVWLDLGRDKTSLAVVYEPGGGDEFRMLLSKLAHSVLDMRHRFPLLEYGEKPAVRSRVRTDDGVDNGAALLFRISRIVTENSINPANRPNAGKRE